MEEQNLVKEISLPIFQSKGWLKLLGVVMIVQGIFTALSIVGIIICWLPIWLGVLLFQAAGSIEGAQYNGNKLALVQSMNKLKMYFMINGILMLIMIIVAVIMMLAFGGAMMAAWGNM